MRVLRLSLSPAISPFRQDGVSSYRYYYYYDYDDENDERTAIVRFCDFWRVADQTDGSDAGSFQRTCPVPWIMTSTNGPQAQNYVDNTPSIYPLEVLVSLLGLTSCLRKLKLSVWVSRQVRSPTDRSLTVMV